MVLLCLPRVIVLALVGGAAFSEAGTPLMRKGQTPTPQMSLYADVQTVANGLEPEHAAISEALLRALAYLRAADAALLTHVIGSLSVERQRMAARKSTPKTSKASYVEVAADGTEKGLLEKAMTCFVDEGYYSEKLALEIEERKEELLPELREMASEDVFGDCRLGMKTINHVIHSRSIPPAAKSVAVKLQRALAQAQHRFMKQMAQASGVVVPEEHAKKPEHAAAEALVQAPATALRGVSV
mmetsp:Transcript_30156/g.65886  ORF Transcript_30156/g.65886 Transcript_30156/m.65886 type:complete len:242 (-) Transcript_30156:54-779(-)|eukprot:CAMPEP_0170601272 /NCGR_PEP_ID=MMETSP0224-20130122/17774_1 /TAXON_ID=285029 /ORGANISM="Togula jolla, Strain CCCM 725" /LENGTH=241 /DNA_ID=CAMNT_0010926043 /DNA_START=86 /DNA_END=811 /DNA_ORIENTATION=+